ncbi:cyclic nucleotide-binding domain-containing protein, partial [Fulvivirga sp. RKSG066]|uniref:cyclic nucleotide-binding domain-containing protein n=1 Tax=Fulvivirga aurantia TaxID=2529383 RepID=UPI0012BBCADD
MINPFKKTYTPREQSLFVFLTKIPLFSQLDSKELSLFLPHMHERKFQQNEVVFFRNDPSHALYLLKKGEVSLNLDLDEDFETLTKIKGPGIALGESCLINDTNRL